MPKRRDNKFILISIVFREDLQIYFAIVQTISLKWQSNSKSLKTTVRA